MQQLELFQAPTSEDTNAADRAKWYNFVMIRVRDMGRTPDQLRKELKEEWYTPGKINYRTYKATAEAIDAVERDIS